MKLKITRKQIIDECNAKIAESELKLNELEQSHLQYSDEDKQESVREKLNNKLWNQIEALENQSFIGNFGCYEYYSRGIIPEELIVMFGLEDKFEELICLKEAMTRIRNEKLAKIKESDEYIALHNEYGLSSLSVITDNHSRIHADIIDVERNISWNKQRIDMALTRSGLMNITKHEAERNRHYQKSQIREIKIESYKSRLIEMEAKK